jgi:hypothetical protein
MRISTLYECNINLFVQKIKLYDIILLSWDTKKTLHQTLKVELGGEEAYGR